jgi:DNA-binding Xre family transcriptional regulator
MVHLFLKPILVARGIDRPFTYLVNAGFSPADVRELLNNDISNFTIAQIDRLCSVLGCTPEELLQSTNKIVSLSEAGWYDALRSTNKTSNWLRKLKANSLQDLSRLKEVVKNYKNKLI